MHVLQGKETAGRGQGHRRAAQSVGHGRLVGWLAGPLVFSFFTSIIRKVTRVVGRPKVKRPGWGEEEERKRWIMLDKPA